MDGYADAGVDVDGEEPDGSGSQEGRYSRRRSPRGGIDLTALKRLEARVEDVVVKTGSAELAANERLWVRASEVDVGETCACDAAEVVLKGEKQRAGGDSE